MYELSSSLYYENNEMSTVYPYILTPPSSSNEDSPYSVITSPSYGLNDGLMDCYSAYLKIVEQPVDKFRFRYISEMAGTHGSLSGINSERNRKATFPTVQLCNFNGNAIIRCSLYQCNTVDELRKPHAHRLMKRYGNEEKEDPHDLTVEKENNYQAIFHSMGIIHTAKKHIEELLIKKQEYLKKMDIYLCEGSKRPLSKTEKAEIKKLANEDSKTINLNKVCLRFDAFVKDQNGMFKEICKPIYSHTINNLKSALTGELKIVRMDHCTSPCTGGREIFILVEKVTKKNIKIRFVEYDDDENEVWSEFGKFNDLDVHHQYAIVFKTPPYKDINLEQSKKVYIELFRPSDKAKSDKKEFVYTPNQNVPVGSKRPRVYNSSSYKSSGSVELPIVLPGNDSKDLPFDITEVFNSKELAEFISSEEVQKILDVEDVKALFDKNIPIDAPDMEDEENIIKPKSIIDTNSIYEEYKDLLAFLVSRPSMERVHLKMNTLFENNEDLLFHNAIICDEKKFVRLICVLTMSTNPDLINIQNPSGYTALSLAVTHNNLRIVQYLIKFKAKTNVQNNDGNTPLHLAVKERLSSKIVSCLIDASAPETLNIENTEGETVLHLAAQENLTNVVKQLCGSGADVNVLSKGTGRNILHVAVENCSLEMVKFLVGQTNICLNIEDFKGYNPLEMACALLNDFNNENMQLICNLLKANTKMDTAKLDIKMEAMSEDEEETNHLTRIKEEFSPEEIAAIYKDVDEIPKACMEDVVDILNKSGTWRDLANLLDLDYLIETNVIDKENPAQNILNVAMANGDSVLTIRDFLENLEEFQAVALLDNMVQQLKDV